MATIWQINHWFHCWVAPTGYKLGFEDKLEDALRDQLVSGLQSEAMHKQLLTETERLTFARAMEITSGMETTAKNARSLHESNDNPGIKHITDHLPFKHCGRKTMKLTNVVLNRPSATTAANRDI